MKKILLMLCCCAVTAAFAVEWNMADVSIVMPKKVTPNLERAKKELEFHLNFIGGKVVENGKAKVVVSLEMSAGQMIEDVKLALDCKLPVELCNRMGGNVPSCAEVCEAVKRIYKEYVK